MPSAVVSERLVGRCCLRFSFRHSYSSASARPTRPISRLLVARRRIFGRQPGETPIGEHESSALNWTDSAAVAWNGASATNYNNNDNVTFYDNNGTSFPANFAIRTSSAGVSPGSVTFTHVANEASGSSKVFTFTDISGAVGIAGSGGLTLTNSFAGTVDLAGGNTFTGQQSSTQGRSNWKTPER